MFFKEERMEGVQPALSSLTRRATFTGERISRYDLRAFTSRVTGRILDRDLTIYLRSEWHERIDSLGPDGYGRRWQPLWNHLIRRAVWRWSRLRIGNAENVGRTLAGACSAQFRSGQGRHRALHGPVTSRRHSLRHDHGRRHGRQTQLLERALWHRFSVDAQARRVDRNHSP